MVMPETETRIALGIVVDEGNVLVIKRQQREIGQNGKPIIWAFPGGKVEPRETPLDAAVREIAEETGYSVSAVEPITAGRHPQYPVYASYIGCKLLNKTAREIQLPPTIVDTQWAPITSLEHLFTQPINPKVLHYLESLS